MFYFYRVTRGKKMNHIKLIIASLLLIALFSCSEEQKQNPILPEAKGTIKGIVTETKTNAPVYYVSIKTIPETKTVYTDIDGTFEIKDIKPGDYKVSAYQQGYDDDSAFVSIKDGDTAQVNMNLLHFSEYLDYYPLEIGNYWEYYQGSTLAYSIEIVSDTTVNNQHYFVSVFKSLSYTETRFERVDSYNALVYRHFPYYEKEMIIDSLPAKPDQKFRSNMFNEPYHSSYFYCSGIEEENIFDERRLVRSLITASGLWPRYEIVKGIGLYQFEFHRVGAFTCNYARINGIEYGEKP